MYIEGVDLEFIGYDVFESSVPEAALEYSQSPIVIGSTMDENFIKDVVNESKGASSSSVLGALEGVFFMPEGKSLNKAV